MADVDGTKIMVQEELSGAGAYINGVAQTISDELSRLIAQLEPIAATWTGTAATYYQGLQQEWNYAANGLLGPDGVLGEIANAMNVNWANYSEAEWANVSTWKTQ